MKLLLGILVFGLTFSTSLAQITVYNLNQDSKIEILGTANVHDWTASVEKVRGTMDLLNQDENFSIARSSLELSVDDMTSGRGRMDRVMHNAMMKDDHPVIRFSLDPDNTRLEKNGDDSFSVTASGRLTIAGTEREVTIELEGQKQNNGSLRFEGLKNIKMSDFGITPPTAMLGSVRAGDEVELVFDLVFVPGS